MSIGIKFGRVLGAAGALAVEGVVRGAAATGGFAVDVMEGAELGYAEKHAALLISRAEGEQRRADLLAAKRLEHARVMTPAVEPITVKVAGRKTARAA